MKKQLVAALFAFRITYGAGLGRLTFSSGAAPAAVYPAPGAGQLPASLVVQDELVLAFLEA